MGFGNGWNAHCDSNSGVKHDIVWEGKSSKYFWETKFK